VLFRERYRDQIRRPVSARYEVVALRAGFALVIAVLVIAWRRELMAIAIRNPYLILRASIEAVIGVLVIYALSKMPIANFTAIILIQPFVMTAIGAVWFKEQVGWRRWTAVVAGFAGMLLVMKPATADFELVSLVALLAALLSLTRDLLVRRIHAQVPTTVISFSTALFAVPLGIAGRDVQPWHMPTICRAGRNPHCGCISFCRFHSDRAGVPRHGCVGRQPVPLFDHRLSPLSSG
jgi:drug/metabolite transporter (DMT)-like permease